jgi:hypothetical protein
MGPIEITFFVMLGIWALIGVIRGYHKELGVTTMLLIALFVLLFITDQLSTQWQSFLAFVAGPDPVRQASLQAMLFCGFLTVIVFISYQGLTLVFPGTGGSSFVGMLTGMLNGYLYAGSLWFYLACANWPISNIRPPYSSLYYAISAILPPAIFKWPYLIGLVVLLLIIRIWK